MAYFKASSLNFYWGTEEYHGNSHDRRSAGRDWTWNLPVVTTTLWRLVPWTLRDLLCQPKLYIQIVRELWGEGLKER